MTDGRDRDVPDLSARAARIRLSVFVVAVVLGAAIAVGVGPDATTIRAWTAAEGWTAPVVFVLLYAALTVALVPGSVLTLAAGLLFGAGLGSVLSVVGATAGAAVAFVVARTAGRRSVERLVSGRAARVDRWLRDRGLLAVITLRLVPLVPFSASNYAAGVTGVRFRDFVVGTAAGIVPGTVAYTVLGARATEPTGTAFLAALSVLALLAVAGTVALRRSNRGSARTGPPAQDPARRPEPSHR